MKKQRIPLLLILTIAFTAFTLGFYLGRNRTAEPVILSIPDSMQTSPTIPADTESAETTSVAVISFPIDINSATQEEFMALPGIGDVLAKRILAYREEINGFSQAEDLLNVEGIGKKRFEEILDLITLGG